MINKTLVRKWIKALNSGLYHESHNDMICTLDKDTGNHCFCAFGVLLDLLPAEKFDWTGNFNSFNMAIFKTNEDYFSHSNVLRALEIAARELNIDLEKTTDLSNRYEGVRDYNKKLSYKEFAQHLKETYL